MVLEVKVRGNAIEQAVHEELVELPPGNLSMALRERNSMPAPPGATQCSGDLLDTSVWSRVKKRVKQKRIGWLHLAFSATPFRPAGAVVSLTPSDLADTQLRIRRIGSLFRLQVKAGGQASIAHPAKSLAWDCPALRDLDSLPSVRSIVGDLCTEGGQHKRPTKWVTNCAWMRVAQQTCPGSPLHNRHLPFGTFSGTLTQQDLPLGYCRAVVNEFCASDKSRVKPPEVKITAKGTCDPFVRQTLKHFREAENTRFIGGLRNPHVSVVKVPGWMTTGSVLNDTLDKLYDENSEVCEKAHEWLGSEEGVGFERTLVCEARQRLCEALGQPNSTGKDGSLSVELFEALINHAQDPDVSLVEWVSGLTPLGIEKQIKAHGIFPPATDEAAKSALSEYDAHEGLGNYRSYKDNEVLAEQELVRERNAGYLEFSKSRQVLEKKHGRLRPSKMGAIVKVRKGKLKTRLVHDLRRSGRNVKVRVPERVVLPRLLDAVEGTLVVARALKPDEDLEVGTLDYIDAFKQLWVAPEERRHLSGQATLEGVVGFFVYLTVLFGVKSGPLVWGRLAAFVMRATAAMSRVPTATYQCFVDDPFFCIGGTRLIRRRALAKTLLLWEALGLKLAWKKGSLGDLAEWIGAVIALVRNTGGTVTHVSVTIAEDKADKIISIVIAFLSQALVRRKEVKEFAGLATWAASVIPPLRPFVQMIWAAASAWPAKGESPLLLHVKRIRQPLEWIQEFGAARFLQLPRSFPVQASTSKVVIGFDASTSGGGAWIAPDLHADPTYWWTTEWSEEDEKTLDAVKGRPEHQATWECYTLVLAASTWAKYIEAQNCRLELRGDAQGVLQAVLARRGRCPIVNTMVAEIQFLLGKTMIDLYAVHVWSEDNEVADALSRLAEGAELPSKCVRETEQQPKRRRWRFIGKQKRQAAEIEDTLE